VPLVDHLSYRTLDVDKSKENPIKGEANLYAIKWEGTDIYLDLNDIKGGKLKGYLDMRDGNIESNMGIPYFIEELNAFAQDIADVFNDIHKKGYTLPSDENGNTSKNGICFFTNDEDTEDGITAKNIVVSKEIMESVYNIATSSQQLSAGDPTGWGNNEIALQLADLRNKDKIVVGEGDNIREIEGLENTIKSIIADLAVESSHSSKMKEGQDILVYNLETQRLSISGVSIDEEMTNLVQYQHAYSAAARMITAIDEALDVLINRTGVVGR